MFEVQNRTPFPAEPIPHQDPAGWDHLAVVVKATMTYGPGGALQVADQQLPIASEDVPHGEPGRSSTRYESDRCPPKPGTDVVLNGHAYAPRGQPTRQVDVELQVGPVRQQVRVVGDRIYYRSVMRFAISEAAPFTTMPLVYERAFGGADPVPEGTEPQSFEPRNPVGTGYSAARRGRDLEGLALPNLEDPAAPVGGPDDTPEPMGFGFIGRHWLPRRRYAGTYDERWQQERAPLLPLDFDARYHNGAHRRLVADPPLRGGERLRVTGATPDGALELELPAAHPAVSVWIAGVEQRQPTTLDTVVVEPDERRVLLSWRANLPIARQLLLVDRIRVAGGPT